MEVSPLGQYHALCKTPDSTSFKLKFVLTSLHVTFISTSLPVTLLYIYIYIYIYMTIQFSCKIHGISRLCRKMSLKMFVGFKICNLVLLKE